MSDEELPEGYGEKDAGGGYSAPGSPAKHAWGIEYQGTFEGEMDGTARAVRLHARALAATGLPVWLHSFTGRFLGPDGMIQSAEAMSQKIKDEVKELTRASIGTLRVRIKHAVVPPNGSDFLRSWILPRYVLAQSSPEEMQALYRQTIVYSVWERTTIEPTVAAILRRVGECWVPSTHNAELLREHGIERVTVIPHPWEGSSRLATATGAAGASREKRFYAIGLWQPRKGFHELIGAFLTAFRPGDPASLTVKFKEFGWRGYPTPDESVMHWLSDGRVRKNGWTIENLAPALRLRENFWTEAQVEDLHLESNIYVSSSHGEAFGLPAFDAKLCGNRMVHVPWGGTKDFASEGDIALPFELERVPESYRWEPSAKWASLDFEALVSALQKVEVPTEFQRNAYVESARFDRVGALMRARVEEVMRG